MNLLKLEEKRRVAVELFKEYLKIFNSEKKQKAWELYISAREDYIKSSCYFNGLHYKPIKEPICQMKQ